MGLFSTADGCWIGFVRTPGGCKFAYKSCGMIPALGVPEYVTRNLIPLQSVYDYCMTDEARAVAGAEMLARIKALSAVAPPPPAPPPPPPPAPRPPAPAPPPQTVPSAVTTTAVAPTFRPPPVEVDIAADAARIAASIRSRLSEGSLVPEQVPAAISDAARIAAARRPAPGGVSTKTILSIAGAAAVAVGAFFILQKRSRRRRRHA